MSESNQDNSVSKDVGKKYGFLQKAALTVGLAGSLLVVEAGFNKVDASSVKQDSVVTDTINQKEDDFSEEKQISNDDEQVRSNLDLIIENFKGMCPEDQNPILSPDGLIKTLNFEVTDPDGVHFSGVETTKSGENGFTNQGYVIEYADGSSLKIDKSSFSDGSSSFQSKEINEYGVVTHDYSANYNEDGSLIKVMDVTIDENGKETTTTKNFADGKLAFKTTSTSDNNNM
jgi:hypothetical protein